MNPRAANEYLKAQVLTASPEQLQLMLFDGAVRFCEQARAAMDARAFERSYELIGKAQKVVAELQSGLRRDAAPELCARQAALYNFCYLRLVDANMKRDAAALDEATGVLRYQRETWQLLLEKLSKTSAPAPRPEARLVMSA